MGETRLKQAGVSGLYGSSAYRTQGAAGGNGRRDHHYDLGVLLVAANEPRHQGAALLQFSDAFYHWLERSRASVPAKDSHRAPVELRSAVLEPQGEEPARTELLLTASPAGGASITTRWLLAESWFPEPTADSDVKALTRWLLKALPWFFIEYVDAEAHRAARIPGPRWRRFKRSLPARIGLVFAAPVAIVVWLVLALLLLVQILRIPGARKLAELAGNRLEQSLGASYMQARSPVAFEAMVDKAQRDLQWLSSRSRSVAVVAMSQGVPVAHELVRRGDGKINLFLTVGSALRKLHVSRQIEASRVPFSAAIKQAAGFFFLQAMAIFNLVIYGLLAFISWIDRNLVVSIVSLALGLAYWAVLRRVAMGCRRSLHQQFVITHAPLDPHLTLGGGKVCWIDLVATADPVPNGPLFDRPRPDGPRTVMVANLASAWKDHFRYLSNYEEVFPNLLNELAHAAVPRFDPVNWPAPREIARRRRLWRLRWLVRARLVAAVVGVLGAIGFGPQAVKPFARALESAGNSDILDLFGKGLKVFGALLTRRFAVFVLVFAAFGLGAYLLFRLLWSRWDRADTAETLPEPSTAKRTADAEFLSTLIAAQIFAVLFLLVYDLHLLASWAEMLANHLTFVESPLSVRRVLAWVCVVAVPWFVLYPLLKRTMSISAIRHRIERRRRRLVGEAAVIWLMDMIKERPNLFAGSVPYHYHLARVTWMVAPKKPASRPRLRTDGEWSPDSAMTLLRDSAVLLDVREAHWDGTTYCAVQGHDLYFLEELHAHNEDREPDRDPKLHLAKRQEWKAFLADMKQIDEQMVEHESARARGEGALGPLGAGLQRGDR